jgi:hypothetical protein
MSTTALSVPTRWWRPLGRMDRWALLWIFAIPVVLFVGPALFGHPAIQADNLIQNFPLRVLSGRQIASGHLPLLDPYANSGSPLLGGLNAGSLYPFTVIFAFIPLIAAWLIDLIAVYVTAALGMFCLLRWHGMRTLSSLAAALSFTYTGAMIGQVVHLGVVQGFSSVPWTLLILLSLSRRLRAIEPDGSWRDSVRVAWWPTLSFALLWGLTFLTGEPRAIAVIELLCLVCVPVLLLMRTSYSLNSWRTRVAYVVSLCVGLAWGVGIGLVQLLPGDSFIGLSERSSISYSYYGAGSLSVRWSTLLLVQDMFGGNGTIDTRFFAHYNLAEVTGYAGLLALVATFGFISRCTRRGWTGVQRDYVLYFVLFVVGLFATWGSFTPVGHLFHHIPLFGSTRLQSRNIIIVDFAASVLLGWWLDRVAARDTSNAGLESRARWFTLLPVILTVALCVAMLGWGSSIVVHFGVTAALASFANTESLSLVLHLVLALAIIGALGWRRRSVRIMRWLLVILSADVIVFLLFCSSGLIGLDGPTEPSAANATALLGTQGRTAFVDMGGVHLTAYEDLGFANLDVFTKLPSVEGYGSLVSTIYDDATGTHPSAELNPCRLSDGTFSQLRLSSLVISSSQLGARMQLSAPPKSSCVKSVPSSSTRRYFGQLLTVHTVVVSGPKDRAVAKGPVILQLLDAKGGPVGSPVALPGAHTMSFVFTSGTMAAGFVISASSDVAIDDTVVTQAAAHSFSYRLDTPFQLALSTSSWRLSDTVGTFAVLKATHVLAPDWLRSPSQGARITSIRSASWGDTWVGLTASSPVVLVRSEAYLPGWRATALNQKTGQTLELPVSRSGLIENVTVPGGEWTVHFHYHAPYIELSLIVSLASIIALGGAAATLWAIWRRSRGIRIRT